jgi:hypothetical protein
MANRFQKNQHELAYRFIAARDGEYCLACGRKPSSVRLEIDHADNNISNWDPDNLHLLCQRCNLKMRQLTRAEHKKLIAGYSAKNVCVRESERGNPSTSLIKEMVDYRQGSPEMQVSSWCDEKYRNWVLSYIRVNGFIPKEEAIYSGAEIVGNSPTTCQRYLRKLTSAAGPLQEQRDTTGTVVISYRVPPKPQNRIAAPEVHGKRRPQSGEAAPA